MILKASQRGGGKQLALHLLNTEDNENCEIHDMRGFVHEDLVGAMKEAYAVSKGTRCKQFLFSLSLNPPQEESVSVDVFEDALQRIEKKLGLSHQPRAVVFHEKEGPNGYRRHCHAVYSRIDAEEMKAVNLPFFKNKLQEVSRDLYLEHGWRMPEGLMQNKAADPRNYSLAEYQQAKRIGVDARDLKGMMQECWAVSDSRAAFEHALSERGLILAKGDRRGFVAVTYDGEPLSLSRYTGKNTKEITERLGKPDESFPSVDEAKARMARDMSQAFNRMTEEARRAQDERQAEFESKRQAMSATHRQERERLDLGQQQRWEQESRERSERLNTGLRGLWDRFTGTHALTQQRNVQEALEALRRDREQRDTMVQAQLLERRALQSQLEASRSQQAALLWELRQDRKPYREAYKEAASTPEPLRAPQAPEPDIQEVPKEQPAVPEPIEQPPQATDRLTEVFRENAQPDPVPVQPSHEDRLQALRDGQMNTGRDNGPEHER